MLAPGDAPSSTIRDWQVGVLLAALGVGLRVGWVLYWRPAPVSDFAGIIEFARLLANAGPFAPGYFWDNFNPALPFLLALLFRAIPADPVSVARLATAITTGLLPLLPWLSWAGLVPRRLRLASGLLLAVWPGQIAASGIVGQDIWVALPTVALGCLAVRRLAGGAVSPVAVGVVWALAGATRQEMLLLTAPLAVAACLGPGLWRARVRRLALCGLAMTALFLGFAAVRWRATGTFRVTSVHAGYTLLGTVAPGATENFWMDPASYVATVEPELTADRHRLMLEADRLAWAELLRRPVFQLARTVAATGWHATRSDSDLLYFSLLAPGVLPPERRASGAEVAARLGPWLDLSQCVWLAGLLMAGALAAIERRALLLAPLLTIGGKLLLHGFLVSQGRFIVPAVLLGIAVLPLSVVGLASLRRGAALLVVGLAAAGAFGIHVGSARLRREVVARDPLLQRTYRYVLQAGVRSGQLDCVTDQGTVVLLGSDRVEVEEFAAPSGEQAPTIHCQLRGAPGDGLLLSVDAGAPLLAVDGAVVPLTGQPIALRVPASGDPRVVDLDTTTAAPRLRHSLRLVVGPLAPAASAPR